MASRHSPTQSSRHRAGDPSAGQGPDSEVGPPLLQGRYALGEAIAAGGMATIYLAHQLGSAGFSRVVAVKRLHPHYASEPEFVSMFLDEARLAARVRHPHVVETLDVIHDGPETLIVLEYVDGESLASLLGSLRAAGQRIPLDVGSAILGGACRGLHAAHEARGADGAPLGIVHRDVSPQNILIGTDGVTRVADFGVALANGRLSHTAAGQVKGKLGYMAPEQLSRDEVTRASDIYAAGVLLWEVCAGRRAYDVANEGALYARVAACSIPRLADVAPWVPPALVTVVERALRRQPGERFANAREMADAIEAAVPPAAPGRLGSFVELHARDTLLQRRAIVARVDLGARPVAVVDAPPSTPGLQPASPALEAPPPSRFARAPSDDTQQRITHTFTSLAPAPGRGRSGALVLAFTGAVVLAAGAGVVGAWLVLGRQAAADDGARTPLPSVAPQQPHEASDVASAAPAPTAQATAAVVPERSVEPASTAEPVDVEASSSAAMPDRMLPVRRGAAGTAASSKPCDPPYFIDAAGIRRVKRDCF